MTKKTGKFENIFGLIEEIFGLLIGKTKMSIYL